MYVSVPPDAMIGLGRVGEVVQAVRDVTPRGSGALPPGQGLARKFPRFGIHLNDPVPVVPPNPAIEVRGAVASPFSFSIAALQEMPRRTLVADFHCVAGWSVRDLRWEGVPFRTLWEQEIVPKAQQEGEITHVRFVGWDGYASPVTLEDALGEDTLIADRLDGEPLSGDHGAPARFVTPRQYGFKNTKHVCRIELHTREPRVAAPSRLRTLGLALVSGHPRARVDREERHRYLPAWSVRRLYRRGILPLLMTRMDPPERR